jgi:outer membrane lipoprotein-sorting protein
MTSKRRALIGAVLLALLVTVSGCLGGTTNPTQEADEIRQQTLSAMEEVETATFGMDMQVQAGGQTIEMTGDGAMDRTERLMRMNLSMETPARSLQTTQYVDGNTTYMNVGGQWITRNVSGQTPGEGVWSNNQFAQQTKALEGATVELNGTTTIDGNEVHILEVDPDEETLRELLQQQGTTGGSFENVDIENFQFTQYVDTESNYIRKVDMQMNMSVQGEQATATVTMTFDNFNEDLDIDIPAEATA